VGLLLVAYLSLVDLCKLSCCLVGLAAGFERRLDLLVDNCAGVWNMDRECRTKACRVNWLTSAEPEINIDIYQPEIAQRTVGDI
jgi:hypothetical protein